MATKKIIYYILLVIVSGLFAFSGYAKLTANTQAIQSFAIAGLPLWFMYVVGTIEILGAISLWIPRLQRFASYALFFILLGAIVVTAYFVNIPTAIFPAVVAFLLGLIRYLHPHTITIK